MASWRPSTVVVDLRELTFVDSYGLRMLLGLDAAAREKGFQLTLVRADGQVRKVLQDHSPRSVASSGTSP